MVAINHSPSTQDCNKEESSIFVDSSDDPMCWGNSIDRSQSLIQTQRLRSSSTAIRSRFLNQLGIHKPTEAQHKHVKVQPPPPLMRPLPKPLHEPLKGDNGARDEALGAVDEGSLPVVLSVSPNASLPLSRAAGGGKCISFETTVTVHPIPRRSAYSDRVRNSFWSSGRELRENVARNSFEFAFEGWDWRQVAEEQDMILYQGEKVHPVHFSHLDHS